ncbi:MAG: lipid A-modifier LpxR family protein [Sinimarinibacterium flocculans]|uniref:lipid A-modifier LpxR family protein n=1 Tax=Sinimarinibacterium flocculans TaxID=985250 RepID=UPI003C589975
MSRRRLFQRPLRLDSLTTAAILCAHLFTPTLAAECLPGPEPAGLPIGSDGREKYNTGWSFYFDNDALTPINRDEDYTGGVAVTLAGRRAAEWAISLDPVLAAIDRLPGIGVGRGHTNCRSPFVLHSWQTGIVAFTPGDKTVAALIPGDRPYASLVYVANARNYVRTRDQPVYQTSLSVGVLGLKIARGLQNGVHRALGVEQANGWDGQIASGGEPTLRYTLARQDLLASDFQTGRTEFELKSSVAGSVGYITDASASLSIRWGRINTPWWSFPPERVEYIAEPAPVIGGNDIRPGSRELYVWGGVKLRARLYNAFLQG